MVLTMRRKEKFDPIIFLNSLRQEAGELPPALSVATLWRLLRLSGEEFVRQAYIAVLQREVDDVGLAANVARADYLLGKLKILLILLLSQERKSVVKRSRRR